MRERKGSVSPLVTVIMLIMVIIVSSYLIYVYVIELSSKPGEPEKNIGKIIIEDVRITNEYRLEINITNNVASNLEDYQVKIVLNSTNFDDWDKISEGKIVFTGDKKGSEPLYYWVESIDKVSQKAVIWVKIPSLPASSTIQVYMWYSNDVDPQGYNDPRQVFLLFDDFNTIDNTLWDPSTLSSYNLENGELMIDKGALGLQSPLSFNLENGYCIEARVLFNEHSSTAYSGTVPELSSSKFTRSGNAGSDATVLYMRNAGTTTSVNYWIGTGSSTGYDGGSSIAFYSNDNQWYITGISIVNSDLRLWKDYTIVKTFTISWAKPMNYISIGAFHGASTYDIKNTTYDWIRIRKIVFPEPSMKTSTKDTVTSFMIIVRNIGKEKLTLDAAYITNITSKNIIYTQSDIGKIVNPGDISIIRFAVDSPVTENIKITVVTKMGVKAEKVILPQ